MAGSLRDQLVKAGLASPDQARKAERQQKAEAQARRKGKSGSSKGDKPGAKADPSAPANVRKRANQIKAEKNQRDRTLAQARNEKAAAKALVAEIKQIILQNDQRPKEAKEDDVPYNFVHGKKIKKIYVPKAQLEQLSSGSLVIVNNDGRYHLLPKAAADQVAKRDPKRIIVAHDKSATEPGLDDEYYARFEVPDDLDW